MLRITQDKDEIIVREPHIGDWIGFSVLALICSVAVYFSFPLGKNPIE